MLRYIDARDHRIMRRLNNWQPPKWVRAWMLGATRAGDGWLWWAAGLAVVLFGGAHRFRAAAAAGISAGFSVLLFQCG